MTDLQGIRACHSAFIENCAEEVLNELTSIPKITDEEFETLSKIIDKYYRVSKIYSSGEGRTNGS